MTEKRCDKYSPTSHVGAGEIVHRKSCIVRVLGHADAGGVSLSSCQQGKEDWMCANVIYLSLSINVDFGHDSVRTSAGRQRQQSGSRESHLDGLR